MTANNDTRLSRNFIRAIEQCKKADNELSEQLDLCRNLPGGGNPLSTLFQQVIDWGKHAKALCEKYQFDPPEKLSGFLEEYALLNRKANKIIEAGIWFKTAGKTVPKGLSDAETQVLSAEINDRRHKAVNIMGRFGSLNALRGQIKLYVDGKESGESVRGTT